MVELDSGHPGASAAALERAVALDGEFEDAIYYLGLAYLERRWHKKALECFRRVQEMDPQRLQYQEAVRLSIHRYAAGLSSYIEVLEAQQQLFPAQNTLSQIRLSRLLTLVQLYKALGGGWKLEDPKWVEPRGGIPRVQKELPAGN